jgi:hypothetical protein
VFSPHIRRAGSLGVAPELFGYIFRRSERRGAVAGSRPNTAGGCAVLYLLQLAHTRTVSERARSLHFLFGRRLTMTSPGNTLAGDAVDEAWQDGKVFRVPLMRQ